MINRNQLKLIAISAMLISHVNRISPEFIQFFEIPILTDFLIVIANNIGVLTFTIMAYLLVEGFEKSFNVNKYIIRIFIFALISQIPYIIFAYDLKYVYNNWWQLFAPNFNVLFTLFFSLVFLKIFKIKKPLFLNILILLIFMIISYPCDWGCYGLLSIFAIYLVPKEKRYYIGILLLFLIVSVSKSFDIFKYYVNDVSISLFMRSFISHAKDNIFMLFTIPMLKIYQGNQGKYNLKYLFYWFYPLHFLILDIIFIL